MLNKILNLFGLSREPMTDKDYYDLNKSYSQATINQFKQKQNREQSPRAAQN